MYESLSEHSSGFHLYIFAFDDLTREILSKLKLQNATVVSLEEFETSELKEVKSGRSKAEYCWTCTPSTISYVFNNYGVTDCTYVDSDLIFYSDPGVLIAELDQFRKNVLITEHRFSFFPRLYELKRGGRFCVQFLTFRNEESSLEILEKWRLQCIDWCYARYEDGKFGDQKYLDEWPSVYSNTHILQYQGGGVAPWNLSRYKFCSDGNSIKGRVHKTGEGFKLVFYHFQYVKFMDNGSYDIGWYLISPFIKRLFYQPYLTKIERIESELKKNNPDYHKKYSEFNTDNFKNIVKTGFKKLFRYNIISI
jgi:hypothetical protein